MFLIMLQSRDRFGAKKAIQLYFQPNVGKPDIKYPLQP